MTTDPTTGTACGAHDNPKPQYRTAPPVEHDGARLACPTARPRTMVSVWLSAGGPTDPVVDYSPQSGVVTVELTCCGHSHHGPLAISGTADEVRLLLTTAPARLDEVTTDPAPDPGPVPSC